MDEAADGLSGPFRLLLDDAESEAKRFDAPESGLLHLVAALARRDRSGFEAEFGAEAKDVLDHLLRSADGAAIGGSAIDFLVSAQASGIGREELLGAAHDRVGNDLEEAARSTAPGQSEDLPEVTGPAPDGVVSTAGADLDIPPHMRDAVEVLEPKSGIIGRDDVVDRLIAHLGRRTPKAVLLVGSQGSGRTSVLRALATRIVSEGYDGPLRGGRVLRVAAERVISQDPSAVIQRVVASAVGRAEPAVVVIDDLEVVAGFGGDHRVNQNVLVALRSVVGRASVPLVIVVDRAFAGRLSAWDAELADELQLVELDALAREHIETIERDWAETLAEHHRVTVDPGVHAVVTAPPTGFDRREHPALLIERLDGACAAASLRPDRLVRPTDVDLGDDPSFAPPNASRLAAELREQVLGQDQAIERISSRLALTRAGLDLNPDRPDGVFLFVGPTGVGKTQLARATCSALFGDERRLIRLDMSEYSHDWATSRLTGPQPGYVGSTEPDSWLTTKVRRQPDTVLLLDEIEKAHPVVWNVFLQVFDAGRLTDSRGEVADFSRTIVVMTSNMGADAFAAPRVGFGAGGGDDSISRVIEKVRQTMPPELVNRLDEIVAFRPLSRDAIHDIARHELDRVLDRLRARGYSVSADDEVVELLAENGYDPAFGARHLHRNIERLLLMPLTSLNDRSLVATADGGAIVWSSS